MGTRNLTCVMLDGKYVVAQYGQWDGYPEGQGKTTLAFCRKRLRRAKGRAEFKNRLSRVRFARAGELEALYAEVGVFGQWATMSQLDECEKLAPYISRDIGATILDKIWNATEEVILKDSGAFAADSLFCEYAYVIDLDKGTFEAYKGFQTKPPPKKDRFAKLVLYKPPICGRQYYPVRMVGKWALEALPTQKELEGAYGT